MKAPNIERVCEAFHRQFGKSADLYQRGQMVFPDGVTHVSRFLRPFPVYVERARGARKWTVEGHELIDYWMGHGALVLGHLHPQVEAAIIEQASKGTHYGACHEIEVEWAEMVTKLCPCAEKVKFVSSGTEATQMVLRLARAYTGKRKFIKFEGHFHGWQDNVAVGVQPPFSKKTAAGIPDGLLENTVVLPASNPDLLDRRLEQNGDVACVIIEPTGASYGRVPMKPGFLKEVREITAKHGILLVFDEVVTGFRLAPGGAQEAFGAVPELATYGKVVAGGLPGAAVAGKAEILEVLAYNSRKENRIRHPGTYNANPLSAAAGLTTLKVLEDGKQIAVANDRAEQLRRGIDEVVKKHELNWCVYGDFSFAHVLMNAPPTDASGLWRENAELLKEGGPKEMIHALRCALLLNGVDFFNLAAILSSAHTEEDIERTVVAFDAALELLYGD